MVRTLRRRGMKKGKRRARRGRKLSVPRALVQRDVATICARTKSFNLTANKIFGLYNWSLTTSSRAVAVARAYQEYRISRVDVFIKPAYDTFMPASGLAVPMLYGVIDKPGAFPFQVIDLESLKQAGARARRLDDKTVRLSFKPAVLLSSDDSGSPPGPSPVNAIAGAVKTSPWLPTNANAGANTGAWTPNSVDHRGYVFIIDQPNAQAGTFCAQVETVIHYQFRRPQYTYIGTEPQVINRSIINLDDMSEVVITQE